VQFKQAITPSTGPSSQPTTKLQHSSELNNNKNNNIIIINNDKQLLHTLHLQRRQTT
jgi:hypothetical protein